VRGDSTAATALVAAVSAFAFATQHASRHTAPVIAAFGTAIRNLRLRLQRGAERATAAAAAAPALAPTTIAPALSAFAIAVTRTIAPSIPASDATGPQMR